MKKHGGMMKRKKWKFHELVENQIAMFIVYVVLLQAVMHKAHQYAAVSKGFDPRNKEEWGRQNWTSGCVRSTRLLCKDENKSIDTKEDGFLKLQKVKVPDFAEWSALRPDIRRSQCLENCSVLHILMLMELVV